MIHQIFYKQLMNKGQAEYLFTVISATHDYWATVQKDFSPV